MPFRACLPFTAIMLLAAACSPDDPEARRRTDSVETRLNSLERRLGIMERTLMRLGRLRDEVATLERRGTALESGSRTTTAPASTVANASTTSTTAPTSLSTTTLPHGAPAPPAPGTRYDRDQRREQLR